MLFINLVSCSNRIFIIHNKWYYGVNDKIVWSQFNHNSKTHKSSVQGFAANDSGWKAKTITAYSQTPKSGFTNQAFWDVK